MPWNKNNEIKMSFDYSIEYLNWAKDRIDNLEESNYITEKKVPINKGMKKLSKREVRHRHLSEKVYSETYSKRNEL